MKKIFLAAFLIGLVIISRSRAVDTVVIAANGSTANQVTVANQLLSITTLQVTAVYFNDGTTQTTKGGGGSSGLPLAGGATNYLQNYSTGGVNYLLTGATLTAVSSMTAFYIQGTSVTASSITTNIIAFPDSTFFNSASTMSVSSITVNNLKVNNNLQVNGNSSVGGSTGPIANASNMVLADVQNTSNYMLLAQVSTQAPKFPGQSLILVTTSALNISISSATTPQYIFTASGATINGANVSTYTGVLVSAAQTNIGTFTIINLGTNLTQTNSGSTITINATASGGSADNLGTHIATQALSMNSFPIDKVSSFTLINTGISNSTAVFTILKDTFNVYQNGQVVVGTSVINTQINGSNLAVVNQNTNGGAIFAMQSQAGGGIGNQITSYNGSTFEGSMKITDSAFQIRSEQSGVALGLYTNATFRHWITGAGLTGFGTQAPDTFFHTFQAAGTVGPEVVFATGTTRLYEFNGSSCIIQPNTVFQSSISVSATGGIGIGGFSILTTTAVGVTSAGYIVMAGTGSAPSNTTYSFVPTGCGSINFPMVSQNDGASTLGVEVSGSPINGTSVTVKNTDVSASHTFNWWVWCK